MAKNQKQSSTDTLEIGSHIPIKVLTCPVRGPLNSSALAKDNLTVTEESRRIDLINFLISKGYPITHIDVETVVIKNLGEKGRNKVRSDLIVYDQPVSHLKSVPLNSKLGHAQIIAEVKRDSKSKASGIEHQLDPALRVLPAVSALGIYWDDVQQILLVKSVKGKDSTQHINISEDNIVNLPDFGVIYKTKPIVLADLRPSPNLMAVLRNLANIFRSHSINDEATRYRETVKIILARYCDERAAIVAPHQLNMQVLPGKDPAFQKRVESCYTIAASRYQRAKALFADNGGKPRMPEAALRAAVKLIQGIHFSAASSETMQQVFMSFVPAVFKKSLDQYFTPLSLVEAMVQMTEIGPNDNIADPAMGTADFLSAAMSHRQRLGDEDIVNRVYGADADAMAYELAIVNMILHKDGQSNFVNEDSIDHAERWEGAMGVVLCNPPFGEKSIENRPTVLQKYDLGHVWTLKEKRLQKSDSITASQHLGILFIEKCVKMMQDGGRLAIILPEGYLCVKSYQYVRQWIVDNLRVIALVELPRRIFTRSDADLRGNILIAQKLEPKVLAAAKKADYPIYAELIRRVGYKLGKGFSAIPQRDASDGSILVGKNNEELVDSDFTGLQERFIKFRDATKSSSKWKAWKGAHYSDIVGHSALDMKPRRLAPKAIAHRASIKSSDHVRLGDVADIVSSKIDLTSQPHATKSWRLVEGSSIRAVEGTVVPSAKQRAWEIAEAKQKQAFHAKTNDIVVGLVRPERRNVGLLIDDGGDLVATPDGVSLVRVKEGNKLGITQEYLFYVLRSEIARIQLWTESGGTSYGKLNDAHIQDVIFPKPTPADVAKLSKAIADWSGSIRQAAKVWATVGSEDDRVPIINSPMFGLEPEE